MKKIKIGIVGYGNLGRGAELAIQKNSDMELVAIFTRRDPQSIEAEQKETVIEKLDNIQSYANKIDVMILCGGSASDLPSQTPDIARYFNTVDSFDTHAKIPEYLNVVENSARQAGHLSLISVGWDPGLFSMMRILFSSVLVSGQTETFWGKGVSQGHSDALRRVKGVQNAVQYTIPSTESIEAVRKGERKNLTAAQKHIRECYVVLEPNANPQKIEKAIKTMPHYFADYHTEVHFVTEEVLKTQHNKLPHGGFVFHNGETNRSNKQNLEFALQLDSNSEFTASVLVAYARAAVRLYNEGARGARTVFDVPLSYISNKNLQELLKEL